MTVWKEVGFEVLTVLLLKVHAIWDRCVVLYWSVNRLQY